MTCLLKISNTMWHFHINNDKHYSTALHQIEEHQFFFSSNCFVTKETDKYACGFFFFSFETLNTNWVTTILRSDPCFSHYTIYYSLLAYEMRWCTRYEKNTCICKKDEFDCYVRILRNPNGNLSKCYWVWELKIQRVSLHNV